MSIFEACVGSYKKAVYMAKRGADRIELCDNLQEGGTTPSYGTIKKAVFKLDIPVMVMIRPRGGSFEYSQDEVEIMKEDIKTVKKLGAYGVVIGVLTGNKIDIDTTKELIEIAKPLSITFHMAFDEVDDKLHAIDEMVELKVDRILTKGGKVNAEKGKDEIRSLVEYANNRISIMPGKGINKGNRDHILKYTGAFEIHGSKIV